VGVLGYPWRAMNGQLGSKTELLEVWCSLGVLGMAKLSLRINLRRADKIAFEKGISNPCNFSVVNILGTRNIRKIS
jgi:hypothetical protein